MAPPRLPQLGRDVFRLHLYLQIAGKYRLAMPEVIPYALRHSSIVRGLRKGLPIQQVAKLHNTSVKMIERHYAKYIATALEDLARAAVVSLVPRSDGNVGPMGKRA
ncbi:hypothetical protein V1279_005703 [Bradyrhizobium sp. AZCC 1610]